MDRRQKRRNRRMNQNDGVKVLPSDIWLEILRRIPATDLHPLSAVCKTFHQLISDDLFTRKHLNHHLTNAKRSAVTMFLNLRPTFFDSQYDPQKRTISVRYDDSIFVDMCSFKQRTHNIHNHRVIDSYHGLLLVRICDRVFLCNPITKSCILILQSAPREINYWKIAYDDVSKQYKVFGLKCKTKTRTNIRVKLCVFDGKSNSPHMKLAWDHQFHAEFAISVASVLVNGNMHFLVTTLEPKTLPGEKIRRDYVISANVTTEEVKMRSCSSANYRNCESYFLGANETFYHITSTGSRNLQLRVLEGVESENPNPNPSWMIRHLIDINRVISFLGMNCPRFRWRVVGMFGDKALIAITTYPYPPDRSVNRLCQYDMSSMEFEEVTVVSDDNNIERRLRELEWPFYIVEHIDSLQIVTA